MMRQVDHAHDLVLASGEIRFDPRHISCADRALFDPAAPRLNAAPVQLGGRQAAWFVEADFGCGVLRHYRRGGLVAKFSANRYVWTGAQRTRSFAEFDLLQYMVAQGLAVPRPLAASYWRSGFSYRAAILVERIPDVQPLAKALAPAHQGAVAHAIFRMHQAGVWHADLNAYNILLNGRGQVWLIDFDRGRRLTLTAGQRRSNLLRLRRSLLKTAGAAGLLYWNELDSAYRRLLDGKHTL